MLLAALIALLASAETHTYKRAGQLEIRAEVFRKAEGTRLPVLFFIHGGALIMGSRTSLKDSRPTQLERYLDSGFVVVSIDYRLAPETKLPAIWSDVEDAYRWVRTEGPRLFGADPNRILVTGQSAGGYLTLLAGAKLKPAPKALVAWYGYGDIGADWYARPDAFYRRQPEVPRGEAMAAVGSAEISDPPSPNQRGRFYLYTRQQGLWPKLVAGFDPATERGKLDALSPLRLVRKGYPPAMLLHGDRDTDVPVEQSMQMADELKRLGVPHELVLMPGLGHGFDRDMNQPTVRDAFEKALRFLLDHAR